LWPAIEPTRIFVDQGLGLVQLGLSPAGDEDVGAFGDEPLRGGQANAATSAGDDGDLSRQSRHV
jgi:hypothetical protein